MRGGEIRISPSSLKGSQVLAPQDDGSSQISAIFKILRRNAPVVVIIALIAIVPVIPIHGSIDKGMD